MNERGSGAGVRAHAGRWKTCGWHGRFTRPKSNAARGSNGVIELCTPNRKNSKRTKRLAYRVRRETDERGKNIDYLNAIG